MLEDLKREPSVTFVYESYLPSHRNRFVRTALHTADRLQWELRKFFLRTRAAGQWLLITNEAMLWLNAKDLEKFRKKGILLAALLIDPMSATYDTAVCARELTQQFSFDRVLTFDPEDAKKYHWTYVNALYSAFPAESSQIQSDLFYMGNVKDRLAFCKQLLQDMENNNVRPDFKLLCGDPVLLQQIPEQARLQRYLPYPEMVEKLQSTKCIFDMTQAGQSGITLRYYEAVVYNKKLLTNNEHIKTLPFYDSRYMKIYHTPEDIDWQWVTSDDMPDYRYDNRFSPVNLLKVLEDASGEC